MNKETFKRRIRKITAFAAAVAMAVSITVPSEIFSNIDLVLTASAEEITPTAPQTNKLITAWQWIDEEGYLDEETGNLAFPGASEQTPAYFDDVTAFLPTQIQATVGNTEDTEAEPEEEIITLKEWLCEDYPETGADSGSYTFSATLPEGYVLSEETKELTIAVELGGATLYETAATWTYPTSDPTLTWEGSGTEEDPYIITTAQELADMSYMVNKVMVTNNYCAQHYKLGADIDLGGTEWVPIGYKGSKFRGYFDGGNHTIRNLTCTTEGTIDTYGMGGLFGYVYSEGKIENVKLENVNISTESGGGALVARVTDGTKTEETHWTFNNCHVLSGTITSVSTSAGRYGGLIGANNCSLVASSVTITNCTNRATVTGSSTKNDNVGGIIGYIEYGKLQVSNCYNYGQLSSRYFVGGIVGRIGNKKSSSTISNCGNEGDINSNVSAAGGIIGFVCFPDKTDSGNKITISGCYNKGEITSTDSRCAGGIVGLLEKLNTPYVYLFIERCYNKGAVTSDIYGLYRDDTESKKYGTQAVSVKNCVYTGDKVAYFGTGDNDAFNRKVTAEELASGKAAVYLNQGLSEENLIWYQNLSDSDKDNYPVTDSTHSKVYASDYCMAAATFSNTEPAAMNNSHNLEHVAQVDAKCGISGLREHYKCNICGELYSDENGTNIVTSVELVIPPTATEHNYVDGICSVCGDLTIPQQDEDGYYLIYTLGELISYADMVTPADGNVSVIIGEATSAEQKARLMADIDMSSVYNATTGKSWKPIGGDDGYFKGIFDGNGHAISGLYINSTSVKYAGLFGRLIFGVCCVHDLTLKDVSINAPNSVAAGAVVGLMDSYKKSPSIKNCMVESGTIIGKDNVGGIAGQTTSGKLPSSIEEGEIIFIDSGYISAIQNCANKASVSATTNAGGLSGSGPVCIADSYNSGTVTGAISGQITGSLSANSTVNNCYYLGTSDNAFGVNSTDVEKITNVAYKSAGEFASGEVAYLIQGEQEDNIWGQALTGETPDEYPVLGGAKVYRVNVYKGCEGKPGDAGIGYSNTDAAIYAEHNLSPIDEKPASCTEDGYKAHYKCDICNKLFADESGTTETTLEAVTIPAAHKLTAVPAKAATCTSNGNTAHYKCSVCGKLFTDSEGKNETTLSAVTIAAAVHKLTAVPAKAATCTSNGNTAHYKCSECGMLFTDENGAKETTLEAVTIPAKGHNFGTAWESTAEGHYHVCTVCGEQSASEAHTKDEGTVTKEATPTESGTITYKCTVCGAKMGEEAITATISSFEVTSSGVVVKYTVTGSTAVKSQTLKFSEVTEEMVELMKSKDIQLVIDFVNYSTVGSDTIILTAAQMKAIEYVLAHDFGIAS